MGERFYYGYFWEGMPDLNLANPEVTAELDSIADAWLDAGIDGFRIDAARHLFEDGATLENVDATFEWLAAFRDRIKQQHPDALVLGEVWDASSMSARYVREGALDVTFDFGLASAIVNSVRSGDGGAVQAALDEVAQLYEPGWLATFLTNHDQDRVMTELGGDVESAKLAATLLLTGGGTPFLYYGEEIGLTGQKPDERIRTPMRWDASGPAAGVHHRHAMGAARRGSAGHRRPDRARRPELALFDLPRADRDAGRGTGTAIRGASGRFARTTRRSWRTFGPRPTRQAAPSSSWPTSRMCRSRRSP